jgi:hypothetical protein
VVGLDEKRKLKELQDKTFPERTKELLEITGSPVGYDVDWKSLGDDLEAMNFVENPSCHRTNMALRVICSDAVGKDAVKDGLKTVRLKNVKDKGSMKITFADGVLEMHCAYALRTDGMFSDTEIKNVLSKGL